MKKITIIFSIVLIFVSLYSQTGSRNIFDKPSDYWHIYPANNSSIELSMGGTTGSANIWDTSPLGISSNPAKLSCHEGISTGFFYSYDNDNNSANSKQLAMYTTISWHGIGLMIPMPTQKNKFGEVNLIYSSTSDDDFGPVNNTTFMTSQTDFALGVEVLQFLNRSSSESLFKPRISIGAKLYETYLDFYGHNTSERAFDFGALVSACLLNEDLNPEIGINLDVSFAYSKINLGEQKLQFKIDNDGDGLTNEDPFDLLDNDGDGLIDEDKTELPFFMEAGDRLGIAFKLAIPIEKFMSEKKYNTFKFADNLGSVMIIFDEYKSSYKGQTNQSTGLEISLLDIVNYRCSLNDASFGFGLNMDVTEHWALQANMAVRSDEDANSYDVAYRYKF